MVQANQVTDIGERRVGINLDEEAEELIYKNKQIRRKGRATELFVALQPVWDEDSKGRELYRNCREVEPDHSEF